MDVCSLEIMLLKIMFFAKLASEKFMLLLENNDR